MHNVFAYLGYGFKKYAKESELIKLHTHRLFADQDLEVPKEIVDEYVEYILTRAGENRWCECLNKNCGFLHKRNIIIYTAELYFQSHISLFEDDIANYRAMTDLIDCSYPICPIPKGKCRFRHKEERKPFQEFFSKLENWGVTCDSWCKNYSTCISGAVHYTEIHDIIMNAKRIKKPFLVPIAVKKKLIEAGVEEDTALKYSMDRFWTEPILDDFIKRHCGVTQTPQ